MNSFKSLGKSMVQNASKNPNYKPKEEAAMVAWIDKYSNMDQGPAVRKQMKKFIAREKERQQGGAEAILNQFIPSTCQLEPDFIDAMVLEMRSTRAYTIKQPGPPLTQENVLKEISDFSDVDNAQITT
jgi:hypothetical protein